MDSLSKGFRDSLDNYSEPVAEGSWEALEADLAAGAKKKVILRNALMAAASVAVLLGLVLGIWRKAPEEQTQVAVAVVEQQKPAAEDAASEEAGFEETSDAGSSSVEAAPRAFALAQTQVQDSQLFAADANVHSEEFATVAAPVPVADSPAPAAAVDLFASIDAEEEPVRVKKSRKLVSLAVLGGGDISSKQLASSFANAMINNDLVFSDAPAQTNASMVSFPQYAGSLTGKHPSIPDYSLYDFEYNIPISFGAYVRFSLPHNFSLETGLFATYMGGKVIKNSASAVGKNGIWYLGIPLKANWSFYSNKYVTSYVSVGGAAEKCISYKYSGDRLLYTEKYPLLSEGISAKNFAIQFSANAAIGVQWNMASFAALFFEPGVSYFFKASNPIETIRNQKPLFINFLIGMRFTL